MARFYRRRRFARRFRPRPRFSRRIGFRRPMFRRRFISRRRYLHPRVVRPSTRAITVYDRTPNFQGDSVIAQFRETTSGNLTRLVASSSFFVGAFFPGSHFFNDEAPSLQQYLDQFQYMRVVKTVAVVQFYNKGDNQKDVGIIALPCNIDTTGELPTWSATVTPSEQPRCSYSTVGGNDSSRSVRKVVASGTYKSADGDLVSVSAGDSRLSTGAPTTAPTVPWYFWVFQGASTAASVNETNADDVQYKLTLYHTVKFYERKLKSD